MTATTSTAPVVQEEDVCGFLFKRRGGFGKMMPHAWQQRYFVISKGFLCYYDINESDTEGLKTIADSKPRGKINLQNVLCDLNNDHAVEYGSPTPYLFQIIPNYEEKWKLCAANKEDFLKWSKAIQEYSSNAKNSVAVALVDSYVSDDEGMSSRIISDQKMESPPNLKRISMKARNRLKLQSKSSHNFTDLVEWSSTLLIMNFCLYLATMNESIVLKITFILVANAVVGVALFNRNQRNIAKENDAVEEVRDVVGTSPIVSGTTSSETIVPLHAVGDGNKPEVGSTYKQVSTIPKNSPPHTWCTCDAKQFQVRIGPDYNRFKKKAPSAPALYEPFAVDVFCTKTRIDHAARLFNLPENLVKLDTNHPHIPPIFVIQIQIPSEPPPSMFTTVEDGPGWAILMFFKITEDTLSQLKDFSKASPAVKLFAEYCEKNSTDPAWRARFKVICSCSNLDEMGLPTFITSYNAKPILIRRTGSIFKGKGYVEKDVHVHKFATIAKQSIHSLSSRCGLMYMQIGFVVEGREENELPEALFGCVAINKPQEDHAGFLFG